MRVRLFRRASVPSQSAFIGFTELFSRAATDASPGGSTPALAMHTDLCVTAMDYARMHASRKYPSPSPSPPHPSMIPLNGTRRTVVVPLVRNELVIVRRL